MVCCGCEEKFVRGKQRCEGRMVGVVRRSEMNMSVRVDYEGQDMDQGQG